MQNGTHRRHGLEHYSAVASPDAELFQVRVGHTPHVLHSRNARVLEQGHVLCGRGGGGRISDQSWKITSGYLIAVGLPTGREERQKCIPCLP